MEGHRLFYLLLGQQGKRALTLLYSGQHSLWKNTVLAAVGAWEVRDVPLVPRLKITTGGSGDTDDGSQIG